MGVSGKLASFPKLPMMFYHLLAVVYPNIPDNKALCGERDEAHMPVVLPAMPSTAADSKFPAPMPLLSAVLSPVHTATSANNTLVRWLLAHAEGREDGGKVSAN